MKQDNHDPDMPPPDHPIWKVWNHNKHSNDVPWRIECAKSGCWECHRAVISNYRSRLQLAESDRVRGVTRFPDEKRDADLKALTEYAAYRTLSPFKRKRGRQTQTTDDIHRECSMVGDYIKMREAGSPHLDALMEVAENFEVHERTVSKSLSLYLVKANK